MPHEIDEREYVEEILGGINASLWFRPETSIELAAERVTKAVLASGDSLLSQDEIDEALSALAEALHDIKQRLNAATSNTECALILAELPDDLSSKPEEWSMVRHVARRYARRHVFHGVLTSAILEAPKRTDRMEELLDVLVAAQLKGHSRRYLQKVARLFVHGFRLEAVVLARAAVEAALREAMSDDTVRKLLSLSLRSEITLAQRILLVERDKRMSSAGAAAARSIAKAANSVLHDEPSFPARDRSAKAYLELLRDVLTELHPAEAPD
jgi:hypothetical protein